MAVRAERADRARDWVVWIAAALGVGLLAFAAGALGIVGRPPARPAIVQVVGALVQDVAAFDCPDGDAIAGLHAETVVYATARTIDGAWIALRDPANSYETVWVLRSALTFSDPLDGLPVDGCLAPPVTRSSG